MRNVKPIELPFFAPLLLILLLVLTGCQTPMVAGSQCLLEPGSLRGASTFAWHFDEPLDVVDDTGYVSPVAVVGIEKAVVAELESKGFRLVSGDMPGAQSPDIEVSLVLRTRRELVSFNSQESPCASNDCWERINTGSNVRMDIRTIGFLAGDIYVDGQPVWRGWVETQLYPKDRDGADEVVARAIPKLFESFPP